jgi:hypothetical protein
MKPRNSFVGDARRRGWTVSEPRWFSLFPPAAEVATLVFVAPHPPVRPVRREAA